MSTVKNLDKLLGKLDAVGLQAPPIMEKGVKKGIKLIQGSAKHLCSVNDGALQNSIKTRTKIKENIVTGDVYTNNDHAAYVEFGTGPKGEVSEKQVPPGFTLIYTHGKPMQSAKGNTFAQGGWWIHVGDDKGDISRADVEKYHFFTRTSADGETFAFTSGQPAQPYLYPALVANKDKVMDIISDTVRREIIKAVKKDG